MNHALPELNPKIILAIAAHPDDLDFNAAGSMAKWAAAGVKVYYLILTDGGKGSSDPAMSPAKLTAIRQTEQLAAARITGVIEIFFAKFEDGFLENTVEVKREIIHHIRSLKPDVVVCWDPTFVYSAADGVINHPDHRASGQASLDAVYPLARDRLSYPELLAEGEEPHKVSTVLMMGSANQNYVSDITAQLEIKLKAVRAHASQMGPEAEQMLRKHAHTIGRPHSFAAAESFVRIDLAN